MVATKDVHFSFVVDTGSHFAYAGWHLARSLMQHGCTDPARIHVQCTPEVDERTRTLFRDQGYTLHHLARFGDGRYCNKLGQLDNLASVPFDIAVLLDTDTIAVSDLRPFLSAEAIRGKVVDLSNPPLRVLDEIWAEAGLSGRPPIIPTDACDQETYRGNCNGGFYAVPKSFAAELSAAWQRWALWLLDHMGPLERSGRQVHVDQISFCLAVNTTGLHFEDAPSNVNYFIHLEGECRHFDPVRPIALLHYHSAWNVMGQLEPSGPLPPEAEMAISQANQQIAAGFQGPLFWEFRYAHFPARGSGVGSRGDSLLYKRNLLQEQGIETATSVLDVGCGDLEVLRELAIRRYVGLDHSDASLALARRARPDWEFRLAPAPDVAPADLVLCFEVLIHQETAEKYRALIAFLAEKTARSLIVSGFDAGSEMIERNPMVFFYEPLETSLRRTGRFREIRRIGAHTTVAIYRCEV